MSPEPTPAPRTGIAAFDVDGTLTSHDCVVPFLRTVRGIPRVGAAFARHPSRCATALARRDRDALKALAISSLAGLQRDAVWSAGERFAREVATPWLRPDTVARLEWHRDQGHRVVLVSASLRPYLEPLGRSLGASAVLCCELEVGPDGRLTGRIDGRNCRAAEKVRRLRAWLDTEGLTREQVRVWAYGDSHGDHELLEEADVPHLVGRTGLT